MAASEALKKRILKRVPASDETGKRISSIRYDFVGKVKAEKFDEALAALVRSRKVKAVRGWFKRTPSGDRAAG